jgi:hypothetical protein
VVPTEIDFVKIGLGSVWVNLAGLRIRNTGLDRDVMVQYHGGGGGEGVIFSNSLHLVEIGPYRNTTKTLPILNIWKSNITLSSDVYRYSVGYGTRSNSNSSSRFLNWVRCTVGH